LFEARTSHRAFLQNPLMEGGGVMGGVGLGKQIPGLPDY
jgi:hypothetical protein